ncbi:MAG TPA: hypothetical protein VFF52_24525 [Isosphaeraceae bacterium]|nr:hypothetical protein [Isosphaeraceae bacterium]
MIGLLLMVSALGIGFDPDHAPGVLVLVLSSTAWPWHQAWRSTRGTGLRPAWIWAALALGLSLTAQLAALGEPLVTGRPWAGRLTYLAVLATLAALVSVLNARTPGNRVWAGLMVLLVVVLLIPWLEAPWRLRRARGLAQLQLEAPWTLFYGLLALVGLTNYLPTRFGAAAGWLALGLVLEYLGLTRTDWPAERRALLWSSVSWTLAASLWTARFRADRAPAARARLERLWFWFRDLWGVVWALRIQERFNRTAELKAWPVRLGWFGLEPVEHSSTALTLAAPPEAEAAFRGLIRRFAQPWRIEEVLASDVTSSCRPAKAAR